MCSTGTALSSSFVFPVQEDAREISNQLQFSSRKKYNAQFYDMSDKLETGLLFFCRREWKRIALMQPLYGFLLTFLRHVCVSAWTTFALFAAAFFTQHELKRAPQNNQLLDTLECFLTGTKNWNKNVQTFEDDKWNWGHIAYNDDWTINNGAMHQCHHTHIQPLSNFHKNNYPSMAKRYENWI